MKIKQLFLSSLLTALLCVVGTNRVVAQMVYNSVVSSVSIVQSGNITENLFTLTIKQDGIRNGNQYANATVTLILESNDRTLEGTYSTANADGNNKINASSVFDWSSYHRTLRPNSAVTSTFVIKKVSDGNYAIDDEGGTLCFTNGSSNYHYKYCYACGTLLIFYTIEMLSLNQIKCRLKFLCSILSIIISIRIINFMFFNWLC